MLSCTAGPLLGGVAINEIIIAMQDTSSKAAAGQPYYSLLSLSAHYNTQLGVLAALQMDAFAPVGACSRR